MTTMRIFLLPFFIIVNMSPPLNAIPDPDLQLDVVQSAPGCASGRCAGNGQSMMQNLLAALNKIDAMYSDLEVDIQSLKDTVESKFQHVIQELQTIEYASNIANSNLSSSLQSFEDNMSSKLKTLQGSLNTSIADVNSNLEDLGCPAGLFQVSGSDQCFKFFAETKNWDSANATCEAEGLVLAKPYDPKALASYMVMRYAPPMPTWIGASGSDSNTIKWDRDGVTLGDSNPMWMNDKPSQTSAIFHVYIHAVESGTLEKPYGMGHQTSPFCFLCELLKE